MDCQFGGSKKANLIGWRRFGGGPVPGRRIRMLFGLIVTPLLLSCGHTEHYPVPSAPTVKPVESLSGCFQRVMFDDSTMESMNQSEPWPEPYQVYCFLSDGSLRTVSSIKPLIPSIGEVREVMEQMPKVQSFAIPASGVVMTKHHATGYAFAWRTSEFVTQARIHGHDFEPGDFHMAIIGKDDQPIYHRYLQRIEEMEPGVHTGW